MREYGGGVLLFAALVGVLLIAIRGFRPRSRWGGTAKARSWGFLGRYSGPGFGIRVLAAAPIGWALGELVHKAATSVAVAVFLGVIFGAICRVEPLEKAVAALVGIAAFLVWLDEVRAAHAVTASDQRLLIIAVVGSLAVSCTVVFLLGGSVLLVPVIEMTVVELVTFGIDVESSASLTRQPIDAHREALIILGVGTATAVLAGWLPKLVLPLVGIGLVFVELAIANGALGQIDVERKKALATLVAFAFARAVFDDGSG